MHDDFFTFLANVLPVPPGGTPNQIAENGLNFFKTWILRIGGLVAFVGAIKFAISVKSDDVKEQLTSIFTMISGFMIQAAINKIEIFKIPSTYSAISANREFQAILTFIGTWTRRAGAVGLLLGAIMFGFSIKDNNATTKVTAMRTVAVGAIIISVSALLPFFV